jgi:glyoxylase-like metal-dependent hydrolase (beta-lactamase superfamily II)
MVDTAGPDACEMKNPYTVEENQRLVNQLAAIGVKPEEIDIVIITHLHWDHSYNNDLFTKARFYLQKREIEYSVAPLAIHKETYFHWERYLKIDYTLLEGDREIVSGVKAIFTPGHTPGSQSVAVDTEAGTYVLISDLTNLAQFWEAKPKVANGVHHDLSDTYSSFEKVAQIADYVLTGHEPEILKFPVYPNNSFPKKQPRNI